MSNADDAVRIEEIPKSVGAMKPAHNSASAPITPPVIDASTFDTRPYPLNERMKDAELFAIKLFENAPSNAYKVSLARLLRSGDTTNIQHQVVTMEDVRNEILALVQQDKIAVYLGCYARISLLVPSFSKKGRGTEKDTAGTMALWVDLDTYKTNYTKEEVFEHIKDGFSALPKPSLIIDSGHGLQAYWLLDVMCTDVDKIKESNRAIAQALKEFGADSTFNPAQMLRIPGTVNRKDPKKPKDVRIIQYDHTATYLISQFPIALAQEKKFIEEAALPPDFLECVQDYSPELYNRIVSEEEAILAGAKTKGDGSVDRSANDAWVLIKLFSANVIGSTRITAGLLMSLMHQPGLLIGAKTATLGEDYALRSVLSAEKYVSRMRKQDPQRFFSGTRFVPALLGEEILLENHFLSSGSQLWIYDEGVFKSDADHYLRKITATKLGVKWQRNYSLSMVDWIRAMSQRNLIDDMAPLANVSNGMLQITADDVKLLDHSPTYCSLSQMPVKYLPPEELVDELKELDVFVEEILTAPEAIKAFYQFIGTVLLPDYRFKKVLLLIGPGDCGKSTLLSLFLDMIGPQNSSARTFQDLAGGNRFAKASLLGKLANVYADLPALEARDVGPFKALTGNDMIDAEFKGVDAVVFRNYAKLIFSANVFPQVKLADQAFFNRWLILPCNTKFVQDAKVRDRIRRYEPHMRIRIMDREKIVTMRRPKILSAMLWRAIEGLQSLLREESFVISEGSHLALGEFMATSDSVMGFFSSCTVPDDNARMMKSEMFEAFTVWCGLLNIEKVGIRVFNRRIAELRSVLGIFEATNSTLTVDGVTKSGNVLIGRKLRTEIITSNGATIKFNANFEIQKTWED